jgi:nucleotide-binding universal stress UspA family protein
MFHSFLVPLDGSPFAEHALPLAVGIGRRAGASVELLQVHGLYAVKEPACAWLPFDPALDDACRQEEVTYLQGVVGRLAATVPLTTAVVNGLPADAILQRAGERHADLIVMTTHGRGPMSRAFLGSVADEVLRRAEIPVLLIRPRQEAVDLKSDALPRRVLIPLDGSPLSEQVLSPALDLVRLAGARCTLLHVVEPGWLFGAGREQARRAEEARSYLDALAAPLRAEGMAIETHVADDGPTVATILEVAEAHDLVALATHGRGGLRRLLLGSVADKLVRAATTPILTCCPKAVRKPKRSEVRDRGPEKRVGV